MKKIMVIAACLLIISRTRLFARDTQRELDHARSLIQRLIPEQAGFFSLAIIPRAETQDVFELESDRGKIMIRGNSANAIAVGLNYYLKYYCRTDVSWYAADPVELPATLPPVPERIRIVARCKSRFFLNYCTFGYTMPWWTWKDWERLIDWMALNGINMPLAITGEEAIWYKVWVKFGLSDAQIRGYFTGPAHLPWHRMSNLDRWQGPLPLSYISRQEALQKRIVTRERELDMTPVLPAFAGHVPEALRTKYPAARISPLGAWGGFGDKYRAWFLNPLDPLFRKIQREFLREQTRQYGTGHIYGADPFNEVKPPSWDTSYLANVAKTIYSSMRDQDTSATWLMMTWVFYFERDNWTDERIKAFLGAVPARKIILLDYYCEQTEVWKMTHAYYGQPFIWCYLGNFGGNTMLAGNPDTVDRRIENAFKRAGGNFDGLGSTLEGFDVNPLMYEYLFEKAWAIGASSPGQWVSDYADRRCGLADTACRQAWKLLLDSIYTQPARLGQATLTNARPTLAGSGNWTTDPHIDYNNADLLLAWEELLHSSSRSRHSYRYDIVNIGRQVLGNYFGTLRDQFTRAYHQGDAAAVLKVGREMIGLLDDMDTLLSTQAAFLLGKWLKSARDMGNDATEKDYYERNARIILTTWGRRGQSLNDYANRSWGGLIKGYYKRRWELFVREVSRSLPAHAPFDEGSFVRKSTEFEWQWTQGHEHYPSEPAGDPVAISLHLVEKYGPAIRRKQAINQPVLSIRSCLTEQGSYSVNGVVKLSCMLDNPLPTPVTIDSIKLSVSDISASGVPFIQSTLAARITLAPGQNYAIRSAPVWTVPAGAATDAYGVYISYRSKGKQSVPVYQTFFRVTGPHTLTTYRIDRTSYRGLDIFTLDGGMSAEYAVEKSIENLDGGLSHSWFVSAPGSGPNPVYATPEFLQQAVEQTVKSYNDALGAATEFNTVIISTGIPSIPYLSNALKAPVLPLHFLTSVNTEKEIQSIMDYSNQHALKSYATLGYDLSVSPAVCWIKLLGIPDAYLQFLRQHHVRNVVIAGQAIAAGGETRARQVLNGSPDPYQPGSIYILYPGNTADDARTLAQRIADFDMASQAPCFTTVADWESGIIPDQVINFSKTVKDSTGAAVYSLRSPDLLALYDLGTDATLAYFRKNGLAVSGVALNPYLLGHPGYESRKGFIPLTYWQGNASSTTVTRLLSTTKKSIAAFFPDVKFDQLKFWVNSSNNFGGGAAAAQLISALRDRGLTHIVYNDYTADEVWDPASAGKAICQKIAMELAGNGDAAKYRQWIDSLQPLSMEQLAAVCQTNSSIELRRIY